MEWIDINKQKPSKGQEVLCCLKCWKLFYHIMTFDGRSRFTSKEDEFGNSESYYISDGIIAWCEITPPKLN